MLDINKIKNIKQKSTSSHGIAAMKPILKSVFESVESSFNAFEFNAKACDEPWHLHQDYEIVLITKSTGKKIIGENISSYNEGDLFIIGPNLPHLFKSDSNFMHDEDSNPSAGMIEIHFNSNFLGQDFSVIPEMRKINKLLKESLLGLEFLDDTRAEVGQLLLRLIAAENMERLALLLVVLEKLANSAARLPLSNVDFIEDVSPEYERFNAVHNYVLLNFKEKIRLGDAAALVCMTKPAFCRYFLRRTNKTFVEYVNEMRIAYACKLLLGSNKSVSEIAYESGFGNISLFNRQFRNIKGTNPASYKKHLR